MTNLLTHIYYAIGIFFIINECSWLIAPKEKIERLILLKKFNAEYKGRKWKEFPEEYKDLCRGGCYFALPIVLWLFLGVFTFQWPLFVAMIIFNYIIINLISRPFRYNKVYLIIHWINSVIGLAFGLFVIVNKYHLHIDIAKYIQSHFF